MPITCSTNCEGDIVCARANSSAEKVSMVTNHCFSAIVINLPYQLPICVAMPAMKDSCSLIAILLFPHWFHWSTASTLDAADRYFSAFPHSSIHLVGANFVIFGEGAPCDPHYLVMIVGIDGLFLAREVAFVAFGVSHYCPFLLSHISISLSFLFYNWDTA